MRKPGERAEEVVGEEHDVDRAEHHDHAVDERGRPAAGPAAPATAARARRSRCPAPRRRPGRAPRRARTARGTRWAARRRARRSGRPRSASDRSGDEPASSSPNTSSTSGASDEPNVVQPTTPRDGRGARQVARVVGGGVDPAQPEPGHEEHQRADDLLDRPGRQRGHRGPVDLVGHEDDVDDGEHGGDDRDHGLQAHDHVEAEHARRPRSSAATTSRATTFVAGAAAPARAGRRRWPWPAWPGWSAPSPSRR